MKRKIETAANVVGIIAEYNPFHNGHQYHLEQAKKLCGAEYAIVIMSGDFVQRGEPAMFDKRLRARWALEHGADMVIQLPAAFSLACAERFAAGAVRILAGTNIVTHLCFGGECADIEKLNTCADILSANSEQASLLLREKLAAGLSYPRALNEAVCESGADDMQEIISAPNNILGVEYIKALRRFAPDILPVPLERTTASHRNETLTGEISSAQAIRAALSGSNAERARALLSLPDDIADEIASDSFSLLSGSPSPDKLSALMLCALRKINTEQLRSLSEVAEGIENNIVQSLRYNNYYELLSHVKSKRYTMARIKRICCCALLGIDEALSASALAESNDLYIRILGVRKDASTLMNLIGGSTSLPIIVRASDASSLSPSARRLLDVDMLAADMFNYCLPKSKHTPDDIAHKLITV